MLLSSTGFSIDLHCCQGQLKSFSLFGEAKSCHSQTDQGHCKQKKKTCHAAFSSQNEASKKDCCSNKTIKVEKSDDVKIETAEIPPFQVKFFTAFVQVFLLKKKIDLNKVIIPHLNYVPPLLNKDIPVLIQSFLL